MTNKRRSQTITSIAMLLGILAFANRAEAACYLLTEQPGNYQSGGCSPNTDVPDYSYPIRNGLAGLGWSNTFLTGANAWPQDFVDPGDYADQFDVTVFLGHGNTGRLYFSTPQNGLCSTGASSMQMGAGTGAKVSSAVFMACCFMEISHQDLLVNHQFEKQLMGFGGVSSLDAGMVNNYWDGTGSSSNVDSWLNNMEDKPGWFTGDNTTTVLSRGQSQDELNWNHWYCGLKRQNCVTGGPGGSYWYLDWHWNGCGGCDECPG